MTDDDFLAWDDDPPAAVSPVSPALSTELIESERQAFIWALGGSSEAIGMLDYVAKAPRILQIALVGSHSDTNATRSTAAEIVQLVPALALELGAWSAAQREEEREVLGLELAHRLQTEADDTDSPALRRLAVTVLMLSIATPLIRRDHSDRTISEATKRIRWALAAILPPPGEQSMAGAGKRSPMRSNERSASGSSVAKRQTRSATCGQSETALRKQARRRKRAPANLIDLRPIGLRVLTALMAARRTLDHSWPAELEALLDRMIIGWAMLCHGVDSRDLGEGLAHLVSRRIGQEQIAGIHRQMIERRHRAVTDALESKVKSDQLVQAEAAAKADAAADEPTISDGLVICQINLIRLKNSKDKEIFGGHEHAINDPLALVRVDDLASIRTQLLKEFPYAGTVVDFLLADLVGRSEVTIRPALIHGKPGGGKTHFVRRFADVLGLHLWITDGSSSDGSCFAGTERRWNSAEPSHPFLAMSRGRMANPLIMIDEIEKAAVRTDYGRLWDALLPFVEPPSAKAIQDKALQVPVDCSHVNYIATANTISGLPGPILDRFRVITFPEPTVEHLDTLVAQLLGALAERRSLDPRFVEPLTLGDHDWIARNWRGGSIRKLSRLVEAIVNARERTMPRQ